MRPRAVLEIFSSTYEMRGYGERKKGKAIYSGEAESGHTGGLDNKRGRYR